MKVSRYIFLASLATAITVAACSDSGPVSPDKLPQQFSGIGGKDTSGGGGGSGGGGNGGGQDTTRQDTTLTPPGPPDGWPRTVLGTVLGMTFIQGGGSDTARLEPVANASVALYKVPTPVPPNYDSLPPQLFKTTTTNAQGKFTLADLPQAGYMVKVTPPAGSPYKEGTMWFTPQFAVSQLGITLFR